MSEIRSQKKYERTTGTNKPRRRIQMQRTKTGQPCLSKILLRQSKILPCDPVNCANDHTDFSRNHLNSVFLSVVDVMPEPFLQWAIRSDNKTDTARNVDSRFPKIYKHVNGMHRYCCKTLTELKTTPNSNQNIANMKLKRFVQ